MEIFLPSRFVRNEMYGVLGEAITPDLHPADSTINFNFSSLSYIEPSGITILSNLFQWLIKRQVKVILATPKNITGGKNCPITYLDDSQFFKRYLNKYLTPFPSVRPTTRPLELISYSNSYQWLPDKFMPWLSHQLNVSINSLDDVKIALEEIFNNINDHSSEHIGCIFAQHYPKWNEVKISISDFGIGIPASVQRKIPLSDEEALVKAIEDGFSTKSTPGNRGAGISNILYSIVINTGGKVYIHSNRGMLSCEYVNNERHITHSTANGFYPGTFFEIVFNTNNIIENEEEDFVW